MKKALLALLFVLLPLAAHAAIATPWNATSTDAGYISPNLINGNNPFLKIFSVSTSTFANGINITNGCFSIGGVCVGTGSGSVTSVFGRTGVVTAQSGDYNTSQVTEVTNLFFTNARAIASVLTGFTAGAGTVTSSDSILTAIQKLAGNQASFLTNITGLVTQGTNVTITGSGTSGSPYVINSTGGGTPGGLNTQVQYNNAGAFAGISGAVTDGTILSLTNALLGGATLTTSSVNGVTLTTGGSASTFLNGAGSYTVPTGSSGSGTVGTSSSETSGRVPFWTTTSATLALLSGGSANFLWDTTLNKLTVTNASTTGLSTAGNTFLAVPSGSVAVGTTTLGAAENVAGILRISSAATGLNAVVSLFQQGVQEWTFGQRAKDGAFVIDNGGNLAATDIVSVLTNGRVGDGTTTPFAKFAIAGISGNATHLFAISSSTATFATTTVFEVDNNGNALIGLGGASVGVGTTSPYAQLAIGGNVVIGARTAGGTLGNLFLPNLATAAGQMLAVDPNGQVIGTTTPAGGVTSISATYPILSTGGATPTLSLAFGTTTSNTWASTQTFTNPPVLTGLSGALYAVSGLVNAVATSTVTIGSGLSYTGTWGQFLGGLPGTLSVAGLSTSNFTSAAVSQWTNDAGYLTSGTGLTSFKQTYGTNQFGAITLATTSASFNGLTVADAITNSGGTFTITPLWSGTLNNAGLTNSTISGVALGGTLNTLTFGTHLTGTSYNGSAPITLATDATNANTAGTIVARDGSGNFTAGVGTFGNLIDSGLTANSLDYANGSNQLSSVTLGSGLSLITGTLSNTGILSESCSSGITCSTTSGATTFTNSGVTSIVAGTNITVSGATGAVTINSTGGSSFAYPFTPSTDNSIPTSATSTPIEGTNPGLGLDVAATSWYGIAGQLLAYASSTNQDVVFGLGAGGLNATTSNSVMANVAVGYQAMNAMTTGNGNVAIGAGAMKVAKGSVNSNTVIGQSAGIAISTGGSNTLIGNGAGQNLTTGSTNIAIGMNAYAPAVGSANTMNIGSILYGNGLLGGSGTIAGRVGIASTSPFGTLSVQFLGSSTMPFVVMVAGSTTPALAISSANTNGGVTIGTTLTNVGIPAGAGNGAVCSTTGGLFSFDSGANCITSTEHAKHDIVPINMAQINEFFSFKPVQYAYNDGSGTRFGFIAEQVATIEPKSVIYALVDTPVVGPDGKKYIVKKGQPLSVDYERMIGLAAATIDYEQAEIEALQVAKGATRSAEENWQWYAIAFLFAWNLWLTIRPKK